MASRTITKYLNFQTLLTRGESAITVVKLMMACNDLTLANEALYEWKKEKPRTRKAHQIGARMYFVRLQIAHLFEALKVIELIRNDPTLLALVKRCDATTQESFQNLEQYLPGGLKRSDFTKLVGRVRSNLTFHYDESGKLIKCALSDRAARSEAHISSLTRGDTAYLWRYNVADTIVNDIVLHQIWGIPKNADLRVEADTVVDDLYQIFLWFIDFSGEFIWKYCGN